MPAAGEMNNLVQIQKPVQTADGRGGWTKTWQNVDRVHAKIDPLAGDEQALAGQLQTRADYRITIRYRDDVTRVNRLLWGARVLDIRNAQPVKAQRRDLELLCQERGAQER